MKKVFCLGWFFLTTGLMNAQTPVITNIVPLYTFPGNKILITGSGFGTPANLDVWFDQVRGTITSSSDFAIEVNVPPQARLANVEVINKFSKLSTKSAIKFVPTYSGTDFDVTKLETPLSFTSTTEVFDVCSCDLDLDGKPDVLGSRNNLSASNMLVLRNTSTPGTLSFTPLPPITLSMGAPTFNIACGDLNGDGKPDVIASRGGANRNQVIVRTNNSPSPGTISFSTTSIHPNLVLDDEQIAFRVVIRDLNLDGKPDIIVSNAQQTSGTTFNVIYVFVNQSSGGTLSINSTPVKLTVTDAFSSYGIDAQDLDGDEKPEIILNQFNKNNIYVLKNTSTTSQVSFAAAQKIVLSITPAPELNQMTTADFNEDGKMDLAVTDAFNNRAFVLLNQSSGTISFGSPLTLATGVFPWGIETSDVDGDGDVDIVVGNRGPGVTDLILFKNNGDNNNLSFAAANINAGKKSRNLRVGDLDGDGKPDFSYTTDGAINGTCAGNDCSWDIIRNKNCFVPEVLNEAPLTICPGQTVQLNSVPGIGVTKYDWTKDAGAPVSSATNPFFVVASPGNYTVTATSETSNCLTTSASFTVGSGLGTLPATPTITSTNPTAVCVAATLQLNAQNVAGASYQWTGPNGFASALEDPSRTNVTEADAGFYTLVLSNGTCNTDPANIRVDIASLDNFSVSSSSPSSALCQGSSLTLSTNLVANHTYQWIKGGSDISGETNNSFLVTQDDAYKVRVTNTVYGCTAETAAVNVTVLTTPVADFTVSPVGCKDQAVTFTDQSQVDARATTVYAWTFGDAGTSNVASPTHIYTALQSVNPSLTVSYSGVVPSCSNSTSKPISIVSPVLPSITVTPATATSICPGDTARLSISGTYASIAWSSAATTPVINVTQGGTFTVSTIDLNGCTGSDQEIITLDPAPVITVTPDTVILAGLTMQLSATGDADSYVWTPAGSLDDPNIANPVAKPDTTTVYTVVGSFTGGCSTQASVRIGIEIGSIRTNVFSPNGDGVNDFWVIPGVEAFSDCTISMFDTQGRRIFEKTGYQNDWDGTYNGRPAPPGTYYFVLSCPNKATQTGHVLVAR